jgi:enoyl-CoA hydratase/carnithine racemase
MAYEFVKIKKEEGLGILTLDRPPANALSTKMIKEIGDAIDELNADASVKVVIVTGAGAFFAAGADVKEMATIDISQAADVVRTGQNVFSKIENMLKPVICAVNGMALGGGNELAMACDIRVAADTAKFGQPEVNLGLLPAYGGTQRLTRLVGKAKAKELIFTGSMISAQEALRIGLVNKVVPSGEELRAAKDIARTIMQKAPIAVAQSKRAINEGTWRSIEEGLKIEAECFDEVAKTEDLREGITAFIEKRPAKFQGK